MSEGLFLTLTLTLAGGGEGVDSRAGRMAAGTRIPRSPEQESGKWCWLRDPVRPCVFWVITGFGIPSAGRGHAVETNVLEPAPLLGPDTPPPSLRPPHPSLASFTSYSVCFNMSKPNRSLWGIHFVSSSFHFLFFPLGPLVFFIIFTWHPKTLLLPHTRIYAGLMPHNRPQCTALIAGVALQCLGLQTEDLALNVSQSAKYILHTYFRRGFMMLWSRRTSIHFRRMYKNIQMYIWSPFPHMKTVKVT